MTMNRIIATLAAAGCMLTLVMLLAGSPPDSRAYATANQAALAAPMPQSSYLFRFDPISQTFFTLTLPVGSLPNGVAVTGTNPTHVWVAETGWNRIGHLIYTNTNNFEWIEYPVTSTTNSGPFRIALHGNHVWFTERGANRIGRLNMATGQIDEFSAGLSPNSGLADIRVAPNGWVWAAGQTSNRLIRLVVTSTIDYAFREYTHTLLVGPFGLAIESANSIWFTAPSAHRIGRLTPSDGSFLWPSGLPADSAPTEIVSTPAAQWFSDPQRNAIGQLEVGTFTILNYYTPTARATGLAGESANRFWFTQQDAQGAVGRLVYTSTTSTHLDYYPLPTTGLRPTGIAVAPGGGVWLAAFAPHQLFLPVVVRNYNSVPPPFAIQMYGSITASTGFTRLVEAGASWIRFPIVWSSIEPVNTTPDNYNWAGVDNSIQTVTTSGVRIIATIEYNPSWAAARVNGPVTNTADLLEFVDALVARYPQVQYWEFYNEPDHKDRFGMNGAAYADMLESIYPVVKSANSGAQVVLGGLALDWFTTEGGPFDAQFLATVLANCSGPCFDVANFHYYPIFRPRWEVYGRDIIGKALYVRQVLASHGFNRPAINTEMGWPAGTTWGSPESAARYVPKAYVRIWAAALSVANWYALTDADSSNPGLVGPGLAPRPAHAAYRVLASVLEHARYVRAIPASETGSARIEGYQFSALGLAGWKRLDVYWYDCPSMYTLSLYVNGAPVDCANSAPLVINAAQVAKIDHLGNSVIVTDAADGSADGRVTIPGGVDTDPIYIDYAP
jgi:virginiamycin B lyase